MSKRAPVSILMGGLIALTACSGGSPTSTPGSSAVSKSAHSSTRTKTPTRAASTTTTSVAKTTAGGAATASGVGIHKIKHVVIIMQENRSFDSYFGTFRGADGIPMKDGKPSPATCNPDPLHGGCIAPYPDHADLQQGGGHFEPDFPPDVNHGKMNGYVAQQEKDCKIKTPGSSCQTDVMGYHTGSDIPNYWSYAKHFVLQDHMYSSARSWSTPNRLFLISGWSALCPQPGNPMSCRSYMDLPDAQRYPYAWTDITYLLHKQHVSWGWYLDHSAGAGVPVSSDDRASVGIWNVLPAFTDLAQDQQAGNIKAQSAFFTAARKGKLPAVSWLIPDLYDSEHPGGWLVSTGQSYVTRLINSVMHSPDWNSTAIFVTWDEWGGFYDHVVPPTVDFLGYGIRVPGLVISPYAKTGYVDHQPLSFDAYLKFIEDDFLGGQRLNPKTDGRPDSRPDVRESKPLLGNLKKDFNFNQQPRPPLVLPLCPKTTLTGVPHPAPYCP
jgi:phospholipase C